jgi:hypothetical protein
MNANINILSTYPILRPIEAVLPWGGLNSACFSKRAMTRPLAMVSRNKATEKHKTINMVFISFIFPF